MPSLATGSTPFSGKCEFSKIGNGTIQVVRASKAVIAFNEEFVCK
jgi:hypothetical protein